MPLVAYYQMFILNSILSRKCHQESEIPIDIATLKLQDWLISRRIVPKNIQAPIKDIHSKISNALQDMPANDQLIKLLSGSSRLSPMGISQ